MRRPRLSWRIEDEMVRGVYIQRSASEQTTLNDALDRYLKEVTPSKKPTTQSAEKKRADQLRSSLGSYSVAAITPVLVADYTYALTELRRICIAAVNKARLMDEAEVQQDLIGMLTRHVWAASYWLKSGNVENASRHLNEIMQTVPDAMPSDDVRATLV